MQRVRDVSGMTLEFALNVPINAKYHSIRTVLCGVPDVGLGYSLDGHNLPLLVQLIAGGCKPCDAKHLRISSAKASSTENFGSKRAFWRSHIVVHMSPSTANTWSPDEVE